MTDETATRKATETPAPWEESTCMVPMWMAGYPAGYCGKRAALEKAQ